MSIGRSPPTSYHLGESDDLSLVTEERDQGEYMDQTGS